MKSMVTDIIRDIRDKTKVFDWNVWLFGKTQYSNVVQPFSMLRNLSIFSSFVC